MARKYVNPAKSSVTVTDELLPEARARDQAAQARLREAESADPASPRWDSEYEAASAAVRATARRVAALEQLRAAQVERGGKRERRSGFSTGRKNVRRYFPASESMAQLLVRPVRCTRLRIGTSRLHGSADASQNRTL
jgi:hypothetical protein